MSLFNILEQIKNFDGTSVNEFRYSKSSFSFLFVFAVCNRLVTCTVSRTIDGRGYSVLRDFTHKYMIYVLHRVTVQSELLSLSKTPLL